MEKYNEKLQNLDKRAIQDRMAKEIADTGKRYHGALDKGRKSGWSQDPLAYTTVIDPAPLPLPLSSSLSPPFPSNTRSHFLSSPRQAISKAKSISNLNPETCIRKINLSLTVRV